MHLNVRICTLSCQFTRTLKNEKKNPYRFLFIDEQRVSAREQKI